MRVPERERSHLQTAALAVVVLGGAATAVRRLVWIAAGLRGERP